jgi:TP901 family phage tail tape measure protein
MLQYNVDTTNAAGATKAMGIIMDQISAGTKLGSANVTQVSAALKITGNEAYNAGIAMSETQAAIQVLGQTGLYGAEAGTKFRNVLAKLGEGRFLPKETQENLRAAGVDISKLQDKTLTLAQRMQELQKVKGDGALLTQMFGENKGAAMALLTNNNLLTDTKSVRLGNSYSCNI